jgi:hypothetical protein
VLCRDRTEYLDYLQGRGLGEGEEAGTEPPDIIVYNILKVGVFVVQDVIFVTAVQLYCC